MFPGDDRLDALAAAIEQSPHNLVARGERSTVRERHLAECLAVGETLAEVEGVAGNWVDLGTGGGLPGLVLALAFPESRWLLVDSVGKKIDAVRGFARLLGVTNVTAVAERAETLAHHPAHRAAYAGVVARALAPLPALVELARGFVGPDGLLAAIKGPAWEDELAAAASAVERCGWRDPQAVRVTSAPRPTWLVTLRAVGPPPDGVPRRVGVPERRPF